MYSCTDLEDVLVSLRSGKYSELCLCAWSPESGLLFASSEQQAIFESTGGVLVLVEIELVKTLRQSASLVRDVCRYVSPSATVVHIAPCGMFFQLEPQAGFRVVPVLCSVQ